MATFEQVKKLVESTYGRIWADWYTGYTDQTKARLDFRLGEFPGGYIHSRNAILCSIGAGNLDDSDVLQPEEWPIWKVELVHEMLHEYQYKVVKAPSHLARQFAEKFGHRFQGKGHDESFFTAICEKAPYFGMSPEELAAHL